MLEYNTIEYNTPEYNTLVYYTLVYNAVHAAIYCAQHATDRQYRREMMELRQRTFGCGNKT